MKHLTYLVLLGVVTASCKECPDCPTGAPRATAMATSTATNHITGTLTKNNSNLVVDLEIAVENGNFQPGAYYHVIDDTKGGKALVFHYSDATDPGNCDDTPSEKTMRLQKTIALPDGWAVDDVIRIMVLNQAGKTDFDALLPYFELRLETYGTALPDDWTYPKFIDRWNDANPSNPVRYKCTSDQKMSVLGFIPRFSKNDGILTIK